MKYFYKALNGAEVNQICNKLGIIIYLFSNLGGSAIECKYSIYNFLGESFQV